MPNEPSAAVAGSTERGAPLPAAAKPASAAAAPSAAQPAVGQGVPYPASTAAPSRTSSTPAPAAVPASATGLDQVPGSAMLPESVRSQFTSARWQDLPGWSDDALAGAFEAFTRSCKVLASQAAWQAPCDAAGRLPAEHENARLRQFFESYFSPWQIANADGNKSGTMTGYYEPLLHGSRTRSDRFQYPLYARPDDLLKIDLSGAYPDLENKNLRGRLERDRVVPYLSREEIEDSANSPLKGKELVWVDDPVDALFLHIQGSGQVRLDSGDVMRVGFADQNGYPFRSVALYLKATGELPASQLTMDGIKRWARSNPEKVQSFLNFNPRYVFFRELPLNLPGPLGTQGVPLTPERSIAVDARFIPLGAPVFVSTLQPRGDQPLNRLMVAQDTGGVITGAVRADIFWGFGEQAGRVAGVMKRQGRMWLLLPKGTRP
jgi:membrane-bound lytic murein transglycosylase A